MGAVMVVVVDVFPHEVIKVSGIEDNDVVEDFPADAADKTFGDSVLPGGFNRCSDRLDAQGFQRPNNPR